MLVLSSWLALAKGLYCSGIEVSVLAGDCMANNSRTPKSAIYLDFNLHGLTPSANMK